MLLNILSVDSSDGTGNALALGSTISDHDDIVECMIVVLQHYLHISAGLHGLWFHAEVADHQLGTCGGVELEVTVHVGDGTCVCTFHLHGSANNWFAVVSGGYGTTNIRLSHHASREEEGSGQKRH